MANTAVVASRPAQVKGKKKTFDAWEVENALDTLKRAAKIRKDPEMMAAVGKMAKQRLAEAQAELAVQKQLAA